MSRVVVIGAGLGGLGAAIRLQGAGHDVTVVEGRERPGGRAYQLRDAGFTWDTGPSLITMPWVLEDVFAAGGMDVGVELDLVKLDPFYRIFWEGEDRHLDFVAEPERMKEQIAKFSPKDAAAFDGFMAALKPIYEDGILAAGRRSFQRPGDLARITPGLARMGALRTLYGFVAGHFGDERIREAFSFHSLFVGGDPFRVPAIYGALVYLQFLDAVWYAKGGVYAMVEALARPLDVRCGERVVRIERVGGAVSGVVLAGGERIAADVVISNADVLRTHELLGRRAPLRRLRPTMSCFMLYLGTDRPFPQLVHHTLTVGRGYRDFIRSVTRTGQAPAGHSTYIHVPSRTEPAMAQPGGDSIAILLPVANLERDPVDWDVASDRVRDALLEGLERDFGLKGLREAIVVEHRMTPDDFARDLGAVAGNAFATEPTLHQSAWFRTHNRDPRVRGLYHVGAGTHPGAGIPGVLLGAGVTAGLVAKDVPRPPGRIRRTSAAAAG